MNCDYSQGNRLHPLTPMRGLRKAKLGKEESDKTSWTSWMTSLVLSGSKGDTNESPSSVPDPSAPVSAADLTADILQMKFVQDAFEAEEGGPVEGKMEDVVAQYVQEMELKLSEGEERLVGFEVNICTSKCTLVCQFFSALFSALFVGRPSFEVAPRPVTQLTPKHLISLGKRSSPFSPDCIPPA